MKSKIAALFLIPFLLTACDRKMEIVELEEIVDVFSDYENWAKIGGNFDTSSFTYKYELTKTYQKETYETTRYERIYDRNKGVFIQKYYDSDKQIKLTTKITWYNVIRKNKDGTAYLYNYKDANIFDEREKIYNKFLFNSFEEARTFLEDKTTGKIRGFTDNASNTASKLCYAYELDKSNVNGTANGNLRNIYFSYFDRSSGSERFTYITYNAKAKEISKIDDRSQKGDYSNRLIMSASFNAKSYTLPNFTKFAETQNYIFELE